MRDAQDVPHGTVHQLGYASKALRIPADANASSDSFSIRTKAHAKKLLVRLFFECGSSLPNMRVPNPCGGFASRLVPPDARDELTIRSEADASNSTSSATERWGFMIRGRIPTLTVPSLLAVPNLVPSGLKGRAGDPARVALGVLNSLAGPAHSAT